VLNAHEQGRHGEDPNHDGNGDGIPDWQQGNVVSFTTYSEHGSHYLTIEVPRELSFRNVEANKTFPALPSWVSLPFGCFSFEIHGLHENGCTAVTVYVDGDVSQTYYKHGPTPDNPVAHWYDFTSDGETGAETIGESTVVLNVCDGKRGDHDLTANGKIVDPGGPAAIHAHPVLYFPYIAHAGGEATELGIINKERYSVAGTVVFYQKNGELAGETVNFTPSPFSQVISGEKTLSLPGYGKSVISLEDIPSNAASAIVSADGNVVGYGRFMSAGGQRYAVPGATRLGSSYALPFAPTNSNWRAGIGVSNPNADEVTIAIMDDSGITADISLTAKGQRFFWDETTESPYRITASGNIAAMEIIEDTSPEGDMAGILLGALNAAELYVPAISFGASAFTWVGLCNPSYSSCFVTAHGYAAGGIEAEMSLGLLAGQSRMSTNLSNMCATDTRWVKITDVANETAYAPFGSVALPLQGFAAYGEEGTEKVGAVSLNALKFTEGIVGVVAAKASPTLTLMNPNTTDATVTVTVHGEDGATSTMETMSIPAGGTMTSSLDSLIGGITVSSGGHIRIESDIDLYGFETIYAAGRMEVLPVLK
jgi:hypothetical protein